jgi:hypothetical protein
MFEEHAMSILGIAVGIEPLMFGTIGLLLGGLVALAALPVFNRRAVRRALARFDATAPASMREFRADKDALRADFAVSAQRLESNIAELRNKTSAHLTELAKKGDLIERLTLQLAERAARIEALEARERTLETREGSMFEQLTACKAEIQRLTDALTKSELARVDLVLEQHRLAGVLEERTRQAYGHEVDIPALQHQVDAVCRRVYELANIVRECDGREALDRALVTLVPVSDSGPPADRNGMITRIRPADGARGTTVQAAE